MRDMLQPSDRKANVLTSRLTIETTHGLTYFSSCGSVPLGRNGKPPTAIILQSMNSVQQQ
uniref:Uncharacterized protein n=1 Tax=Arion vulgaris TaxID=1028688 RepID=A0A0B7A9E0_9EUPU